MVAAAQTKQQFWPETDFYLKFNPKVRADFVVARSQDPGSNDSIEIGPDAEFSFRRFVKRIIVSGDSNKNQFLTVKVGYHYLVGVGQPSENRGIISGTSRFPLKWSMLLSERNRIDLRGVDAQPFSWRYRNRVKLERSFRIRRVNFTPYVDGEGYWTSTSNSWSQYQLDLGANFPIRKWVDFTPYFEHLNKFGSPDSHTNAIGFTTAFYFSLPKGR
jgi:hypothetical protein